MNWEAFHISGYVSVALGAAVVLLLIAYRMRPRWLVCQMALLLAVAAFALAKFNSKTHVERIQLDRSEQLAEWEERQEEIRQAAAASRGEEVAQIRFAEDASGDFMDKAGMDEADLRYMEKIDSEPVPEWMKSKKTRSGSAKSDDSIEGQIGGEGSVVSVGDGDPIAEGDAPLLMSEADLAMANRLDGWNIRLGRLLIVLTLCVCLYDYLRRANIYEEAGSPLRLPSSWLNSVTPLPAVRRLPQRPRRNLTDELAWLARRGDTFVYLTDNAAGADKAMERFDAGRRPRRSPDVLRVGGDDRRIDDEFIFETLWYGRSSIVIDSGVRAEQVLAEIVARLAQRKSARARVRQAVHVVWDLRKSLPAATELAFARVAEPTGFSLLICDEQLSVRLQQSLSTA